MRFDDRIDNGPYLQSTSIPSALPGSHWNSSLPAHNSQCVLWARSKQFNFRENNTPGATTDQTDIQAAVFRPRTLRKKRLHSTTCRRIQSLFCAEKLAE